MRLALPTRLVPVALAAGLLVALSSATRLLLALRPDVALGGPADVLQILLRGLMFDLSAAAYLLAVPVLWFALLPGPAYVLKRELLFVPLYGWYARAAGMIAVDRSAGAAALRHLVKAGQDALAQGRQIVIFPEGTRTAPGTHRPYQPGIAALYARAGLPVVPVATDSGLFWGRRAFHKRPGTITVAVLPPVAPGLGREAFLTRLTDAIEGETDRLLASAPPSA